MITVSDYIVKVLEDLDIKNVYMLSGGMIMYLTESLRKSKLNIVPVLHEQSAGIMAEAESIYNNDIGVCVTTSGPGILNVVTAIASAYIDSNPLLIIAGQCKTTDSKEVTYLRQKGIQEVDAIEILKPITKYAGSLTKGMVIKEILEQALYECISNRPGPVFIEIPLDIQNMEIDEESVDVEYVKTIYYINTSLNNSNNFDKLIELINNSKKPLIIAGNGIINSGSIFDFKNLLHKLRIPTLLTWKSMDLLEESNDYYIGRHGTIGQRGANIALQECDLLINIGSRLDLPSVAFDYKNFAKNAYKVVIDIDQAEMDKLNFDLNIQLDTFKFLYSIDAKIDRIKIDTKDWLKRCKDLQKKYPICLPEYYNNRKNINPYVFIEELSKKVKEDYIIVPSSSGSASEITCQAFKVKEGQKIICSNGLGSMGFALPHAIGASMASNKKKTVVCIEGDGSIHHNLQELELIKRYNLPIKLFIWNNNGYASIRNTQNKFFDNNLLACDDMSGVTFPNLYKIATAYGIRYSRIPVLEFLDYTLDIIFNTNDPVICEVMIDPDFQTQPKVMSQIINGEIVSGQLENMWPYLEE